MIRNSVEAAIPAEKTRRQVAGEVGISYVYLEKIIAGDSVPSIEIALKLSEVLKKPLDVLFERVPGERGGHRAVRRKKKSEA